MIQAIKDLANAFVPSGRLIELVDITLVRVIFISLNRFTHNNWHTVFLLTGFMTSVCFMMFCSRSWWTHSQTLSVMKSKELQLFQGFHLVRIQKSSQLPTSLFLKMSGWPLPFFYNVGEVALFNIFYEVFTVCTSVVAEDDKGVSSSRMRSFNLKQCFISTELHLGCVLLQVTSFMVEIWILDYLWGKNHP